MAPSLCFFFAVRLRFVSFSATSKLPSIKRVEGKFRFTFGSVSQKVTTELLYFEDVLRRSSKYLSKIVNKLHVSSAYNVLSTIFKQQNYFELHQSSASAHKLKSKSANRSSVSNKKLDLAALSKQKRNTVLARSNISTSYQDLYLPYIDKTSRFFHYGRSNAHVHS